MKMVLLSLLLAAVSSAQADIITFPNAQCPGGVRASVHESVDSLNWYGMLVYYCDQDIGCGSATRFQLEPAVNDFGGFNGAYASFVVYAPNLTFKYIDLATCTAHFTWRSLATPGDVVFRDTFGMDF